MIDCKISSLSANERGFTYTVTLDRGWFTRDGSRDHLWEMVPEGGKITLNTRTR